MKLGEIREQLSRLPQSIFEIDVELAKASGHLAELKESLEIAELNAELTATLPEKSNEDTRKRIRAEAVTKSLDVKRIKSLIIAEHIKQSEHEAARSMNLRQFQAMMALAELAAAEMNMLAAKTRKETMQWLRQDM